MATKPDDSQRAALAARLSRFVAAVFLVLGIAPAGRVDAAFAFPRPTDNFCMDQDVTYAFSNADYTWEESEMDAVRNGFDDWQAPRDWDGSLIVDTMLESGLNEFTIYKDATPGGSANRTGWASCWDAKIELHSDLTDLEFYHWARHEMGHLLGNEHTGVTDSFGGQVETMATCQGSLATALSQDDWGGLAHKLGGLFPADIHANSGFESGVIWWGTYSASSFYTTTDLPWDGPTNLRFRPSAANGYVYQSMNYAAAGGTYVDARVNYRKLNSEPITGTLKLDILVRYVSYPTGGCATEFETGKDQNTRYPDPSAWYQVRTRSVTPQNYWQMYTEPTPYQIPTGYDAVDIRIRVRSDVKYTATGVYALLGLDTTRARDRS